jgi:hypothetical protein
MFTPCPVGPFRQRGLFLSEVPILTILGPYLPQLHLVKVSRMLECPCHYRQSEIVYQVVLNSFFDPDPITSSTDEEDLVLKPMWETSSSFSHDYLDENFPSNEAIIKAMNGSNKP